MTPLFVDSKKKKKTQTESQKQDKFFSKYMSSAFNNKGKG